MVIELFGRNEQPPEEMTRLAVLGGQKSVYRFGSKCLVEKALVQSPSIAIWQKSGNKTQSTPGVVD
jgi:hypothetical protein